MADTGDDLIGFQWTSMEGEVYTVDSHYTLIAGYMICLKPNRDSVIRPIHAIRQRMLLDAKDDNSP
jgi:hypothetical protein